MEEYKNQQENGTIDSLGPPHNKILQGPPSKNKGHGEQYNTIILKPAIIRPLPSSPYRLVTHGQRIERNFHLYMNMPWIAWQFAKSQPGGTPFQGDGNINTYTKPERKRVGEREIDWWHTFVYPPTSPPPPTHRWHGPMTPTILVTVTVQTSLSHHHVWLGGRHGGQ